MTGSAQSGIFVGNLQVSRIVQNVVTHTAWAGIIATAAAQGGTGHLLMPRNSISAVPHEGIQVAHGQDVTVRDNFVTKAGQDGYTTPKRPWTPQGRCSTRVSRTSGWSTTR